MLPSGGARVSRLQLTFVIDIWLVRSKAGMYFYVWRHRKPPHLCWSLHLWMLLDDDDDAAKADEDR